MPAKKKDTTGSKTPFPVTESSFSPLLTLKDLYDALNWSAADFALADFCGKTFNSADFGRGQGDNAVFSRRFRLILLHR